MLRSSLAAAAVLAVFVLAVAGCGSSPSSSSTPSTGSATAPSSTEATTTTGTDSSTTSDAGSGGSGVNGSGGGESTDASSGGGRNANGAALGSNTSKTGDNSIQTYGAEAQGGEKAAVVAAMRSFLGALAARDYAKVCAGVTSQNRASLAQFAKLKHTKSGDCPALLGKLLTGETSAARKAANGTVTHVRIGGDNAFVLFRPAGGGPVSYFVMTIEAGQWKSTSLAAGTPLVPTATNMGAVGR